MKVIIDLDSTLCGFSEAWNEWLYNTGRTETLLLTEEVLTYDWYTKHVAKDAKRFFLDNPHHTYRQIKPYVGAKEFINYCKENFEYVEILTHSCNDRTTSAKINYCIEHFDFYNVNFVDSVEAKFQKVCSNSILIDDYPATIIKHAAYNKSYGILFNLHQRFGWSRLRDYMPLINELNPNMKFISSAYNYEEAKRILEIFL